MKIAILGASGMLGSMLTKYLSQYYKVVATVRDDGLIIDISNVTWRHLDVLRTPEKQMAQVLDDVDYAINAIGVTNKEAKHLSERDYYRLSFTVNGLFPKMLAYMARIHNFQVIQIATDCVYSGNNGLLTEKAVHDAGDVYGRSKSEGELMKPWMHHIRCSIVGPSRDDKQLLGWYLSQPEGSTVKGYTNHLWNGITTLHFAKLCHAAIKWGIQLKQLQHIVPADSVSKYTLLNYFKKCYGHDVKIVPALAYPLDRVLATNDRPYNQRLWEFAGYPEPPTIEQMVQELAEYESANNSGDAPGDNQT